MTMTDPFGTRRQRLSGPFRCLAMGLLLQRLFNALASAANCE
jgi:hypothetical protein